MKEQLSLGFGALLCCIASIAAWVWLGPFAGSMLTGVAFYIGGMVALILARNEP